MEQGSVATTNAHATLLLALLLREFICCQQIGAGLLAESDDAVLKTMLSHISTTPATSAPVFDGAKATACAFT